MGIAEKAGLYRLMAIAKRAVAVLKKYDYDNLGWRGWRAEVVIDRAIQL